MRITVGDIRLVPLKDVRGVYHYTGAISLRMDDLIVAAVVYNEETLTVEEVFVYGVDVTLRANCYDEATVSACRKLVSQVNGLLHKSKAEAAKAIDLIAAQLRLML